MYAYLNDLEEIIFDKHTIIGALCKYVAYKQGEFQPMSANMGLINYNEVKLKDKKLKNEKLSEISLNYIKDLIMRREL
jgi:folate-dependent tRNA-U54 methylase TrmFO/GidA